MREVSHILKAIHAQENRAVAEVKARAIVDELRRQRHVLAAKLVEESIGETLTYYAFPELAPMWARGKRCASGGSASCRSSAHTPPPGTQTGRGHGRQSSSVWQHEGWQQWQPVANRLGTYIVIGALQRQAFA